MTDRLSPPPKDTLPEDLTAADIAALEMALREAHADISRNSRMEGKLREEGWLAAAHSAVYALQCDTLNLCGEVAPCDVDDVEASLKGPNDTSWHWGEHKAARLVKRMTALGVSRFHPDPLAAIEQAQQTRR